MPTSANADKAGRGTPLGDKSSATEIVRAALLRIEACSIGPAAWLLRHAHGATIATVYGHEAVAAAVADLEVACNDLMVLVQRLGGAA